MTTTAPTLSTTRATARPHRTVRRETPVVLRMIAVSIVLVGAAGRPRRDACHGGAPVRDLGLVADRRTAHGDRASDRYLAVRRRHHGRRLVPSGTSGAGNAPTTLRRRSHDGLRRRGACAQEAGSDPAVAGAVTTLSTDLPAYSGVVQEANFNERRRNYPLAAAYLAEANNLMRTSILPAAAQVYGTEVNRLADDQSNAASTLLTVLAVVAFFALLAALVLAQRWLSGRFHRTWNIALAGATVLVVVMGLWAGVALFAQNSSVASAERNGSGPVSTFTDARILALRARADDELTLLTRDSDTSYQKDYASTAAALKGLLARQPSAGPGERSVRRAASGTRALRLGRLLVGPPAGSPRRLVWRSHGRSGAGLGAGRPRPARCLR